MPDDSIHLEELLAPTASSILSEGKVVKDDPYHSLWLLAQDAFGWENWLRDYQIPFQGSAHDLFQRAREALELSEEEADAVLKKAHVNHAIPACIYKGNQDESINGNGDLVAWAHLLKLKPSLSVFCPPETKESVTEYFGHHRKHTVQAERTEEAPAVAASGQSQNVEEKRSHYSVLRTKPARPVPARHLQKSLNTTLANLGRELVDSQLGEIQGNQRNVNGEVQYRISVNLADNTMHIYAKDRGNTSILIDVNGQIDQVKSQATIKDVERFQQMVRTIRAYQPKEIDKPKLLEIG